MKSEYLDTKLPAANKRYKKLPELRLFKGCSPLQLLCNLIGNRPQTATFHTANRCLQV